MPDAHTVPSLTRSETFLTAAAALADQLGRRDDEVVAEAVAGVNEMAATHARGPMRAWKGLGRRLTRQYDYRIDHDALRRLRALDNDHTLIWLPSHRSYLDTWAVPQALDEAGFPPYYVMGGINLDFWPFGDLARRTGLIFIRRNIKEDPVYRFALRQYLRHLVRNNANFGWSIEGGRTRTGKLRPPRYGILRYVTDAVREEKADNVLLVPVSIVYDQLQEVPAMAAELRGGNKRPEDIRWLIEFSRGVSEARGSIYIDVGEPIPLAERLAELDAEEDAHGSHQVERVALQVCHRINRVTPAIPAAAVTIALLGADRGLTMDELLDFTTPLAVMLERRGRPIAADHDLDGREILRKALDELVDADAVIRHDGGTETVWALGPDQHLVAAFYRNSAIHLLVARAVIEVAHTSVAGITDDDDEYVNLGWQECLRLRDLLKFEFFFPRKRAFLGVIAGELELMAENPEEHELVLAPLVLRPFLEAYLVLAECLLAFGNHEVGDEDALMDACLGLGRQWLLQRRLASAESVSLELFKTALALARHRELLGPAGLDVAQRRQEFANELRDTLSLLDELEFSADPPLASVRLPAPEVPQPS